MSAALAVPSRASSTMAVCEQAAALLERVKVELPDCEDIEKLVELRDMSEAMRVFLRQRDAAQKSQNDAAEIKLRTQRRIGEITSKWDKLSHAEAGRLGAASCDEQLARKVQKKQLAADAGLKKDHVYQYEQLAALPEEEFEAQILGAVRKNESVTSAKAAVFSSESDEWYTPQKYIESARKVLGGTFDIDPASNPKANELVRATRYFTIEDSGLEQAWTGRVWLNPPYGDHKTSNIATWVNKMVSEYERGHMSAGILLVNQVPDRKWFKQLWQYTICATDHRIEFYTPSGTPRSPVSSNAFVYFGKDIKAFAKEFDQYGDVVRRVLS